MQYKKPAFSSPTVITATVFGRCYETVSLSSSSSPASKQPKVVVIMPG